MRIALIAPPWLPVPPLRYGGTEAVVDRLARGLHAAGHDVLLFTTGDSTCPVPKAWLLEHADTVRMGAAVPEVRHIIAAYDRVKDHDIVHDHTVIGPVYAEREATTQVVTTNHGPFNDELADIYRSITPRVPIIAISHHQASTAGQLPVAAVIHHGVDPERFRVGSGDGGYHLFLGRMAPDKGARRAAVVARQAGIRLLIAARMQEPWELEYFADQVQPLLTPEIEYVGEVGGQEKIDLLGGARALINPIRWPEPFGLVMIEALACGTPVLAFREGAAPEIVDHGATGFLCDDEDDMVTHVSRVDGLDRADCRRAVESSFSTERMVREHVELYERLTA